MPLYHWFGANLELFRLVNGVNPGKHYDSLMLLLSFIGDHDRFTAYFIALLFLVAIRGFIASMAPQDITLGEYLVFWFKILLIFALAYAIDGAFVKMMKIFFSMPRPFIVLDPSQIRLIGNAELDKAYASFPSGHASFITVLVTSLWPAMRRWVRPLAVLLVLAVCWSRLALGVHFPVDLLAGVVSAFCIAWILRQFILRPRI